MKQVKFRSLSNDLFAEFKCDCGDIYRLSGYNDNYFFSVVNERPQVIKCPKCNKEYAVHWTREGVKVFE